MVAEEDSNPDMDYDSAALTSCNSPVSPVLSPTLPLGHSCVTGGGYGLFGSVMASGKPSSETRPSVLHHGHFTRNRLSWVISVEEQLEAEPSALRQNTLHWVNYYSVMRVK